MNLEVEMGDVFIVEAVRSPIGRRNGGLSGLHPSVLLGKLYVEALARTGIPADEVGQVLAGCVTEAGEQAFNIARTAWLTAGLPQSIAASTVDAQCGSAQQSTNLAAALVGAGVEDVVFAGGIEMMSRVPLGSNRANGPGHPISPEYEQHHHWYTQFEGAEMIARRWGIGRDECDEFGLRSQTNAITAWAEGRFEREVAPIVAPTADGGEHVVGRDEGLRDTSLDKLSTLKPVLEGGVHTAGSASQISDGAAVVVLASTAGVERYGLTPRARITHQCLVGVDPEPMLTGPIDASRKLFARSGLGVDDVDLFEVNEAFASVVLAWQREIEPDPDRVNVNGGAIALGHPVGSTGARLITTALHELERRDARRALVTMCCGGGLGTGTILERA